MQRMAFCTCVSARDVNLAPTDLSQVEGKCPITHLESFWSNVFSQCYKYRTSFDQTSRNRMREKVTASIIFRDRKASYAKSVSHPFHGDYVRLRQNVQWKKICMDTNDQYVVFADIINKITRSSGKVNELLPILLSGGIQSFKNSIYSSYQSC